TGEREASFWGLLTRARTEGFSALLMSNGISSADKTIKIFRVLIFLMALAKVLMTPAVCRSDPTPLIKASAMAREVRFPRRNLIKLLIPNCWYRAITWGSVQKSG